MDYQTRKKLAREISQKEEQEKLAALAYRKKPLSDEIARKFVETELSDAALFEKLADSKGDVAWASFVIPFECHRFWPGQYAPVKVSWNSTNMRLEDLHPLIVKRIKELKSPRMRIERSAMPVGGRYLPEGGTMRIPDPR